MGKLPGTSAFKQPVNGLLTGITNVNVRRGRLLRLEPG
jgi:hypothetical protein